MQGYVYWFERHTHIDVRERDTDPLPPVRTLTRGRPWNLGTCPDQELSLQPFGVWDDAPTNGATRPGLPSHLCLTTVQISSIKCIHIIVQPISRTVFISQTQNCTHQTTLRSPLPSTSFHVLDLWIGLLRVPPTGRITQHLSFCDWLISLGAMFLRFIHLGAGIRISFLFHAG